jgi:hypothetical protein
MKLWLEADGSTLRQAQMMATLAPIPILVQLNHVGREPGEEAPGGPGLGEVIPAALVSELSPRLLRNQPCVNWPAHSFEDGRTGALNPNQRRHRIKAC